MKKNLLKWIGALLIAIVSLGFVSCGDDDEKEDDVSIIGTWCSVFKDEGETAQAILIFNEDGTGTEKFRYSKESDVGKFKYIFDKRAMTLEIMLWNDKKQEYNSEIDIYNVSSLTSTTLVIGEVGTYYRQ